MDLPVDATAEVKYIPDVDVRGGQVAADDDVYVVDFDGPDDHDDPLNWSKCTSGAWWFSSLF